MPASLYIQKIGSDHPAPQHRQNNTSDPVRPKRVKERLWRWNGSWMIAKKQIKKLTQVGCKQDQRNDNEVNRKQFDADIIGHVQGEDLDHVCKADESAQRNCAR